MPGSLCHRKVHAIVGRNPLSVRQIADSPEFQIGRGPSPNRRARLTAAALVAALAASLPAGPRADISHSQELKARAFSQLSEGIEAYRKADIKRAIEILEQVARVALNSFRAYYYLGVAYKADRQYTRAIEPLSFALELDPTNLQAHVDLGDCYLKRGDIEESLAEYHRSIAVQPGYAPAYDGLGRAAEASGDDDKAIEQFKKAIDLNPGFPDAALNLGDLYLSHDRLDEAVQLFVKAIGVRPDFAAAHNRLGVAYARQRLGNEAIAALRRAAELEKGNPWHPYTIGTIEMDFGNLSQASADFDTAISLDKNYIEAYVAKARLSRRLGDFTGAVRLLDEALARPSEDEKLRREIVSLRDEVIAEGKRHDDLQARLSGGSATPEDRRALAGLRASGGDFAAAASILELLAQQGAGGAPAEADLFRLGYYQLRAGRFEEAEKVFTGLREKRPGSLPVLIDLALALQGQGKNGPADEVLEAAQRLAPGDATAFILMGNAKVAEGRWGDAAADYEGALAAQEEFPSRSRVEVILKALQRTQPAAGGAR